MRSWNVVDNGEAMKKGGVLIIVLAVSFIDAPNVIVDLIYP